MKLPRRNFLHLAASVAALPAVSRIARAQAYPTRPVRLIVPLAPGGATDIVARLMGQWLSERLGQPFVIENRPGGGGNIGTEAVVRAPADGYTLLMVGPTQAINATLYEKLNFNFLRDIAPIAGIIVVPNVMVVNPSSPARTVPEFIAYAKANPGKLNLATSGAGSASELYGALFKAMAGADLVTVPYRGVGPASPDLMSGRVDVMFDPLVSAVGFIRAGKLRALGVTTTTRRDILPDVPSIAESVPGYDGDDWTGISTAANTPPEVIAILNRQVNAALADPAFKARLAELGVEPFPSSPAAFGKFIGEYTEKWGKVIRAANIKPE
jgi:tripartite-type tricarboxylate transporter receptor subunit TctC